jgi:hypothetical protein
MPAAERPVAKAMYTKERKGMIKTPIKKYQSVF